MSRDFYEVGKMPGVDGFTVAVFKAEDVPVGSRIYKRNLADEQADLISDIEKTIQGFELYSSNVYTDRFSEGRVDGFMHAAIYLRGIVSKYKLVIHD